MAKGIYMTWKDESALFPAHPIDDPRISIGGNQEVRAAVKYSIGCIHSQGSIAHIDAFQGHGPVLLQKQNNTAV